MTPLYVAKKSCLRAFTPLRVLFFWLIIPTLKIIIDIIQLKNETIEFYEDYVLVKSGVLSKNQRRSVFAGVYAVSINQSLFGRIFNYGDVLIDVAGKWDIGTEGIKNPQALATFLEGKITTKGSVAILNN